MFRLKPRETRMRTKARLTLLLLVLAVNAFAQLADLDPDWKELDVPRPPAFKTDRLVSLEMPRHISTKVGIDPGTLRVSSDGIVRYVAVAMSGGGTINASYEGIRCVTGEVRVYARYGAAGQWISIANAQWKPLNGNQPSPHALILARQGACDGRAAADPATAVARLLQNPMNDPARR